MSKLKFNSNEEPTVGIELELGLVDANTLELSNSVQQMLSLLPDDESKCFKPELMQSFLEINTCVCNTIAQAEADLRQKTTAIEQAADKLGLQVFWGSTHPFSHWQNQQVTPDDRYLMLVKSLQEMARRLITFGLHVHVGVDSGDKAVMICDRIMQHLPTLLALTCSSPYWEGRDTGLASYRSKVMEGLPTAGLPTLMRNWSEYVWLVNHMVDTGFINTIREIWWDVRPHHNFGTVEVRVCDMPGNLRDSLAIAALCQCLIKYLSDDIDKGAYQHDCHPMMVRQNKWRAARFGNQAALVNSFTYEVESVSQVVHFLLHKLRPTAEALDCVKYLEHCETMADSPSWAERQRMILEETGDHTEVVRRLCQQARISPPPDAADVSEAALKRASETA